MNYATNEYFNPLQANRYKSTGWIWKVVKKIIFLKCYSISVRLREAAKKNIFLVVRPLRGGGVKVLVVGPLGEEVFFVASLMQSYGNSCYCNIVLDIVNKAFGDEDSILFQLSKKQRQRQRQRRSVYLDFKLKISSNFANSILRNTFINS